MPRKVGNPKSVQFSVTLPVQATELMMRLGRSGFFANSRGEIARELILTKLRELGASTIADALKGKARSNKPGKKKARHR